MLAAERVWQNQNNNLLLIVLWRGFYDSSASSALLVPILIIAAGQLAGSLAWLAISGEDAPDLIAPAPVTNVCVAFQWQFLQFTNPPSLPYV